MSAYPFFPGRLWDNRKYFSRFFLNRFVQAGCVLFCLAGYLAQHSTLAPNAADGALILEYIRMMADGKMPFWHFIDIYGPINWIFPTLFFCMAGKTVWGIRVWILILKCIIAGITWLFVRKMGSFFYAFMSMMMITVVVGQPWQYFQTAYASHTALPLILTVWYFLFCSPLKKKRLNIIIAAFVTAVAIWTKLNSGMFLFAGGLYYLFYLLPGNGADGTAADRRVKILFRTVQSVGLLLFCSVFLLYIKTYMNKMYFFYLAGPLIIAVLWTFFRLMTDSAVSLADIRRHLFSTILYLTTTLLSAFGFYLLYFGWDDGLRYWSEVLGILGRLDYMVPFPPLGMEGIYKGFNEYYWLQLPWLMTLLFIVWLVLAGTGSINRVLRRNQNAAVSRISGIYLMAVLCGFAMYSRSDETHIIQAVFPSIPVIFILLSKIESVITFRRFQWKRKIRWAGAVLVVIYMSTIATVPTIQAYSPVQGIWNNPSLQYLKFSDKKQYIHNRNDRLTNEAAVYVDSITEDGTPVLILCENQLINFNSHTIPVGGRYQYIFYLLRSELINRQSFEELLPESLLKNLLDNPPQVIVSEHRHFPLMKHIPEFRELIEQKYVRTKIFGHIFVYEKKTTASTLKHQAG